MVDGDGADETRWEQVEALFDAAMDLPADRRAAWLDSAIPDPALRRRVDELLQANAHAEGDGFLGSGLLATPGIPKGETVGPYRIVEELGRGGMGVVYLADRADGQFEQQVALKVVKRGLDTDEILWRFLQERQILARLQHPHIARLLDGGVTRTGQPYIAMERISGLPLTTFCDEHRLDIEARLRLFQHVGDAVQYAHRNLVVHRDLKPSNILVTEDGTVKLLDFGIAKLLDGEAAPALTRTGMRVLSPAYAAPEQVAGEPVTTATDVYSLGVVLYELLTGRSPHAETRAGPRDVKRPSVVVGNTVPFARPGDTSELLGPEEISHARATQPNRLRRRLSGDLDTICLRALRPEPEQRYESVAAFVEDVRRHLAGLPVVARADTTGYRLRKFIRRNRVLVTATALVFLSLSAGLAVALWQAQRARTEATRATVEAATSEQVKQFLATVFVASDPREEPGGAEVTARELLARGAERVGELEGEPAVQAELMDVLGNVYASLGLYREARSLLEQALAKRRVLRGAEHKEVATSMMSLAGLLIDMGAFREAEPHYRDALAMRRRLLGPDHIDVAAALNDLALLLLTSRDAHEEAEPLLRESLAIQRRHYTEPHPTVAISLANLAGVMRDRKAYDQAERLYREALSMKRQLFGTEHASVAASLSTLALVLRDKGATDEAETLMRESLAIRQRLFGEEHDLTAGSRFQLAQLLLTTGAADEAEPLFRQALSVSEKVNGVQHWRTARARVGLGRGLIALGRYDEAESQLEQAHAIYGGTAAGGPPTGPAGAISALVELYEAWGRPDKAKSYRDQLDRER